MKLDITGRHVTITDSLRTLIEQRLARLERLLNDNVLSGQVILTKEKYRHRAEILVRARGDHNLRGRGEGAGWPLALRQAAEKIEQQAHTVKGKWLERKRRSAAGGRVAAAPAPAEPAAGPRVIRATRYAIKPMSVEDAALRVDGGTDTFLVFRNADSDDAVSILYRRKDGHLGLIEPD